MSRRKTPQYEEFTNIISQMESFNIDRAMQIAEEVGVFDNYNSNLAIARSKRDHVRSLIGYMRTDEGDRKIRSYKDDTLQTRQYINISITRNVNALMALINIENDTIGQHIHIKKYLRRRKHEIEGQQSLLD